MGGLLLRGMLAGLLAGLVAFAFARVVGEPFVEQAVAVEGHAHTHGHGADAGQGAKAAEPEQEVVSRATQAGLGLFTGVAVYATAIGGLFAIVFALAHGRIGTGRPQATAAVLALAGFTAFYLVPWLKYPANPPSIGAADTIGARTGLYFVMVAVSVIAAVLAALLARMAAPRLGGWNAGLLGVAAFLTVVGLWGAYLPPVNEVAEGFSATLLWNFRLASLGTQFALWAALGLLFGVIVERDAPKLSGAPRPAFR